LSTEQIKTITENVKLSFSGYDTDKGMIDIQDLEVALYGWREFYQISTSAYLNKELSIKPISQDIRPRIKIQAFEKKSFDVITTIAIPLGLMITYDIVKSIWKWRISLIKKHIKNKKGFLTREESIDSIKLLATSFEIKTSVNIEAVKFLDIIDDALINLMEPVDHSAQRIVISSNSTPSKITLTSIDKRALESGYHVDVGLRAKGFEKHTVKFIRINTETGYSIITFKNQSSSHQMGHVFAKIIDINVSSPKNVYTRAMYEGTGLDVWGRMVRSRSSNKFMRWEITVNLPSDDAPLFKEEK